tara:strand:+ start:15357 stop:16028 length:672 start_codon:yes stop_codon:yes gene_type:complete
MPRISEKIESAQTRLAVAAKSGAVPLLLAVSKTRSENDVREAVACGLLNFGENYLQEATAKIEALTGLNILWHFIGSIQSNKTADIANQFDWVHTLDRIKIARRLSEQRAETMPNLNLLIQLNIDNEDSKGGIDPSELMNLAAQIVELPKITLRGLMAIPAPRTKFEDQLEICKQIHNYYLQLQQQYPEVDTLSMGMSADLEAATQAGSNLVRIGTDIFGPRQ